MVYVDFVFVDYIDHVVVVYDDVCGCCVHAFNGDMLVCRKLKVVCYVWVCRENGWCFDVVIVVISVVLIVVIVVTCCCYDDCVHGELLGGKMLGRFLGMISCRVCLLSCCVKL